MNFSECLANLDETFRPNLDVAGFRRARAGLWRLYGQGDGLLNSKTCMNYYYLGVRDEARESWVLFDLVKANPKRVPNPELPSALYQLFGPSPLGDMRMKSQYLPLCCAKCGRYDEDAIFSTGFSTPAIIHIKGDYGRTRDRILVVNERFLKVIQIAKVRGYETKPIGSSGWHALQVTHRVECMEGALKRAEPYCPECGRSNGSVGSFQQLRQLAVPEDGNTFFTTKVNWHRRLWDRDIFVSEGVVTALKAAGIKGGYCNRLWTDEEVSVSDDRARLGKRWKPPKSTVLL